MGRNNNSALSDVINSRYDNASSKKRHELDDNEKTKPGNLIKDPVRCPLCLTRLLCPRNKDYDEFVDNKLMRCLHSDEPTCKKAVANPKNKAYLEAVQVRVAKNGSR